MRIRNPNFVPAVTADIEDVTTHAAIQNFLAANANKEWLRADEIRAALPAVKRAKCADGVLQEIARKLGLKFEP